MNFKFDGDRDGLADFVHGELFSGLVLGRNDRAWLSGHGVQMKTVALLLGALLGVPVAVSAQTTCTPAPIRTLAWGTSGQTIVPPGDDKTTNLVPAGKVWLIKAAGIGQGADPGVALEYRLQIDHRWPI
jgi:hypothetical protein